MEFLNNLFFEELKILLCYAAFLGDGLVLSIDKLIVLFYDTIKIHIKEIQ